MNLPDTLRPFVRRWYVAVPLLLLTLAGSFVVRAGVSPGYTVTAAVIVLPPSARVDAATGTETSSVNPLLGFNSSTLITTQALTIIANAPEFQERVSEPSELAAYSIIASERQPILRIAVESKDLNEAVNTANAVIAELGSELDRQQGPFPPSQKLLTQTLSPPSVAAVDNSKLRAFVVALGVGIVASAGITFLVDALLISAARRGGRGYGGAHGARESGSQLTETPDGADDGPRAGEQVVGVGQPPGFTPAN
ncbi:hypothetical protein DQ244_00670 [Blastococcus sp. TBT05-19]|uniref:hypothetical protein n=1 Tax=Blastococcus sp. TBT05-19 TaxID=2250581 RepID=UPI000DE8029A|nr:hypothetical protein [Blastococcus sp. TBT05-19]RBY93923.1 hypothetical protein DQ244_00670 [Blastococcus sp. TBT05-19]